MANTTTITGNTITITGLDADWDASTDVGKPCLLVSSCSFKPHAASDRMIIPQLGFDHTATDGNDNRNEYYDPPIPCNPTITIADCTVPTTTNMKVIIRVAKWV